MSDYDDDRRRSHRHRRDDREPRYVETQETYVRSPVGAEPPYIARTTELVRRPVREDSDLSIEEVRREFPPPGAVYRDRYGPRSRSAERGSQYGDPRRSHNDLDDRRSRKSALYVEQEIKPRRRSLSRNQKIIAGVAGAALAVGSKELWDRKKSEGHAVKRNPLQTAAIGAAGAFAGYEATELYAKHGAKGEEKIKTYVAHRGRDGEVEEYYSSDDQTVRPKRSKSRRKSIIEGALGLAGLGAAAKATGGGSRRHSRRRGSGSSYDSRDDRSRRGKSPEGAAKFQQAAKAALLAGATEAFRVRKEPGGWGGDKGKRILTAAIGASAIDAAADRHPEDKSKRHILEAVVGGLAGNRLLNGSRKEIDDDDGRSVRSRSRSRGARSRSRGGNSGGGGAGPLAALATAGLGALAGKKLLDRSRSRSRGGDKPRRRRYSSDSYDSRSPSPRRGERRDRHKRSKSVSDYAKKGLAALGVGGAAAAAGRDRDRDDDRDYDEPRRRSHRSERGGSDDGYVGASRRTRRGDSSRDIDYEETRGDPYGEPRYAESRSSNVGSRNGGGDRDRRTARQKDGQRNRKIAEGKLSATDSESDLGSSTDDEKRIKKMKGKQLITAGLATVATIHAAHGVYQSIEKRDARHKAVAEGEMTPEEARKLKAKATLQDVASVAIAALGIKGALSEIKEANEMRHECRELRAHKEERHKKRLERLQNRSQNGSNNSSSGRRRRDDGYSQAPPDRRIDYGPRYADGNPYSALPAPPVGYYDGR